MKIFPLRNWMNVLLDNFKKSDPNYQGEGKMSEIEWMTWIHTHNKKLRKVNRYILKNSKDPMEKDAVLAHKAVTLIYHMWQTYSLYIEDRSNKDNLHFASMFKDAKEGAVKFIEEYEQLKGIKNDGGCPKG